MFSRKRRIQAVNDPDRTAKEIGLWEQQFKKNWFSTKILLKKSGLPFQNKKIPSKNAIVQLLQDGNYDFEKSPFQNQ